MRKYFSSLSTGIFAMLVLAHFGFVSCSDDSESEVTTYKVSTDTEALTFEYNSTEAQTVSVTVTPTAEWSLEETDEWITCEKSGNTLTVSVAENTDVLRQSTITIKVDKSGQAEVATATLAITQEAAPGSGIPIEPNVSVAFDAAIGAYMGVSEVGYTGEYIIELTKDDKTLTLVAFNELAPIPSRFLPEAGEYQAAGNHEFHTFIVGSLIDEQTVVGTKYKYGSREVMVKEGSFSLTFDAGEYTLTANMKGEDANYNQHEMEFSFTGEIPFESYYEPDYIDLSGDVYASFYGDRNAEGISRYNLNITGSDDGMGNYYAFKTKYLYSSPLIDVNPVKDYLYIPSGIYKIQEEKALFSMPPGYLAEESGEFMNSYFVYANVDAGIKEAILAEYGSMALEYNPEDKTYEIYGHIAGKDMSTGEIRSMPFKSIGSFPVSNMNASVEYSVMKNARDMPITVTHHLDDAYPGEFNELIVYYYDDTSTPNNNVALSFNIIVPLDYDFVPGELPEGTFEVGSSYESPSAFSIVPGTKISNMLRFSGLSITEKTGGYPMGYYMLREGSVAISKEDGKYGIVGNIYGTSNTGKVTEIKIDIHSKAE